MLEQMVESANVAGNKRRSYFILSGISVSIAAMALLIFDIYTANFEIGDQGLLSNDLLSPIAVRPLQPEKKQLQPGPSAAAPVAITRPINQARIEESKYVPEDWSAEVNRYTSRPNQNFIVAPFLSDSIGSGSGNKIRGTSASGPRDAAGYTPGNTETDKPPPSPRFAPRRDNRPAEIKRLGIVNGFAIELPKPQYPPAAIALNLSDLVHVQVTIDEIGNVIAARAVKGNPIFRAAAEDAARKSKFSPTTSEGIPVKVTGLIIYNFIR